MVKASVHCVKPEYFAMYLSDVLLLQQLQLPLAPLLHAIGICPGEFGGNG